MKISLFRNEESEPDGVRPGSWVLLGSSPPSLFTHPMLLVPRAPSLWLVCLCLLPLAWAFPALDRPLFPPNVKYANANVTVQMNNNGSLSTLAGGLFKLLAVNDTVLTSMVSEIPSPFGPPVRIRAWSNYAFSGNVRSASSSC